MKLKILISIPLLVLIIFIGCKKFDLDRIAKVRTDPPSNVTDNSVNANGSIVDLGQDGSVQEYGFCLSFSNKPPTIEDKDYQTFYADITGDFSSYITGLTENRSYQMRAYLIENSGEVTYGEIVEFTTGGVWLHYDSGNNDDNGVGLTGGGTFDIAIRFPTQALSQYNGYNVTKIRFFPRASEPSYYITLWEGTNPPSLTHVEQVYPSIDQWNEFIPSYIYTISSSQEFWAGLWIVDHLEGTYPAGCDEGPAVTGAGDMISFDDGDTWEALSISNPDLDYNWNLQVYVTNQKGEEIQMIKEFPAETREKKVSTPNTSNKVSSAEMNK